MSNTSQAQPNQPMTSPSLQFLMSFHVLESVITRKFDHMGGMVGFNDFIILYQLSLAEDQKLRRIDLADKVGLTASGITRLLPPLEKLRLVERESNPRDARVSYVKLTVGGQRVLEETLERAEHVAGSLITQRNAGAVAKLAPVLEDIRRAAL